MATSRGIRPERLVRATAYAITHPLPLVPWHQWPAAVGGFSLFVLLLAIPLWKGSYSIRDAADLTSTFVFAFTGALLACRHISSTRLAHLLPIALLAGFLTGNGGGTVRTLILQQSTFFWWDNPDYLLFTAAGALSALICFSGLKAQTEKCWDQADFFALAVFAPYGAEKALLLGLQSDLALLAVAGGFGFLTGAGGGLIRDTVIRRPPTALVTPYGYVAAVGGAVHLPLSLSPIGDIAWILSAGLTYGLAKGFAAGRWHRSTK